MSCRKIGDVLFATEAITRLKRQPPILYLLPNLTGRYPYVRAKCEKSASFRGDCLRDECWTLVEKDVRIWGNAE